MPCCNFAAQKILRLAFGSDKAARNYRRLGVRRRSCFRLMVIVIKDTFDQNQAIALLETLFCVKIKQI